MRVALVCPYAWDRPGGVQSHIRSLAPALARRGHDVSVVAPASTRRIAGADVHDVYRVVFVGTSFPVPANGSVAPISFGPRAAARLKTELGRIDPDVVHVHEPLIPSLSLLALGATHRPIVGTFHAARDASLGYRAAQTWLRRRAARIHRRTAVSDAALALARRYFPGDYTLTPNGVDVERFATARPLDLGTTPTILFVGRIERRKGLEVLIQAVAGLRDRDVRLVVVGNGPRLRASRLLAGNLRINSAWLGRLSDEDVARVYRSADVYCAPNLGLESFGIVLLEAMAAGTPIVCSDLDAFRRVAGGVARLVPAGNAPLLAEALRDALAGGGEVVSRVEAGGDRASGYDWARLGAGVEGVDEGARRR